jgi:bifunctional UDP-N-acetylglucosamine pyrophosphorylase/glucosamine-1-phosphate N-acetyltransferase
MNIATIVLSAGKGTRMNSEIPKVLHKVLGKEIILWSTDTIANFQNKFFVIGHQHQLVAEYISDDSHVIIQEQQLGTGHALLVVFNDERFLSKTYDYVLVIPGDVPLMEEETLNCLISKVVAEDATIGFVVASVDNPFGYGRVILDKDDNVLRIVEDREASEEEKEINLINSGIYCFKYDFIANHIGQLSDTNNQHEFYLTDLVELAFTKKQKILVEESTEVSIMGINSMDQLHNLEREARDSVINKHIANGIYFQDATTAYIDKDVVIGTGTKILANTHLIGKTVIGENCNIGPNTMISDSDIGPSSTVIYSVVTESSMKQEVQIGPYAHLRPGSNLGKNVKVGAFAETKKSNIGDGSKVPHLAYVGDGEIEKNVNFSAGAITVNYDGENKNKTVIKEGAFIGSDVMLVAPITIGEGAFIGAGSVVTKDVPSKALAVERSEQKNIEGYADRKKNKKDKK